MGDYLNTGKLSRCMTTIKTNSALRPFRLCKSSTNLPVRGLVSARYFEGPLFQRSAISKVHCVDTHHSANVWVKVKVKVRVRVRIRVRVIGLGSALG